MFKSNFLVSLVVFSCLSCGNGWVLNNVDFSKLAARSLMMDLDDSENEIRSEDIVLLKLTFIYPGTKWCGTGNIADGYNDLGSASETDMCCREHDFCPDDMLAGETKHNITNDAFYTRLNCDCDRKFRSCLRAVRTQTSATIGNFYFNTLNTKCFSKDYPVINCKKRGGWFNTKCIAYSYDYNGEQRYQWFDLPPF